VTLTGCHPERGMATLKKRHHRDHIRNRLEWTTADSTWSKNYSADHTSPLKHCIKMHICRTQHEMRSKSNKYMMNNDDKNIEERVAAYIEIYWIPKYINHSSILHHSQTIRNTSLLPVSSSHLISSLYVNPSVKQEPDYLHMTLFGCPIEGSGPILSRRVANKKSAILLVYWWQ